MRIRGKTATNRLTALAGAGLVLLTAGTIVVASIVERATGFDLSPGGPVRGPSLHVSGTISLPGSPPKEGGADPAVAQEAPAPVPSAPTLSGAETQIADSGSQPATVASSSPSTRPADRSTDRRSQPSRGPVRGPARAGFLPPPAAGPPQADPSASNGHAKVEKVEKAEKVKKVKKPKKVKAPKPDKKAKKAKKSKRLEAS
ncbi:MAG: hypothetical protein QOG54_382 [Actinomycetota bacterium]|jgi:hypothetical protein|nr:hypothetical protein [Actinomycetota bacterium]